MGCSATILLLALAISSHFLSGVEASLKQITKVFKTPSSKLLRRIDTELVGCNDETKIQAARTLTASTSPTSMESKGEEFNEHYNDKEEADYDASDAEPIKFLFNNTIPYDYKMQQRGTKPFGFADGYPETQKCLGLNDADLWNARVAALGTAFPVIENTKLPEVSPADGFEIIENAEALFDEHSVLHVHGVTEMTGPGAIGSYLGVPHSKVSAMGKSSDLSREMKITGINSVEAKVVREAAWKHLGEPQRALWEMSLTYYPCSTKIKTFVLKFPDSVAMDFISSSRVPGAKEAVCRRIMDSCTDQHQQFEDHDECMEYMTALPELDPVCQHNIGPFALQGNSFMCKYLHQFMTPFDPEYHCYHSGKGRFDSKGTRKCAPTDCIDGNPLPASIAPNLVFPPDEVKSETYFKYEGNRSFVETIIEPEVPRDVSIQDKECTEREANEIASATILSLPYCMTSLSTGLCNEHCSRAVATLLGRYSENGALCRCQNHILDKSVILRTLQVDAEILLQLAAETLENVEVPSCINAFDAETCNRIGVYRGKNGCFKWNFDKMESHVYSDWSKKADYYNRVTKDDLVASVECMVLSGWQSIAKSPDFYYTRDNPLTQLFPGFPDDFVKVHPSQNSIGTSYEGALETMRSFQERGDFSLGASICFAAGNTNFLGPLKRTILHSTGTSLHSNTRQLVYTLLPGLLGSSFQEDGHTFTDILHKVAKLHGFNQYELYKADLMDVHRIVNEVAFRALLEDKLPYIDSKLGDDLKIVADNQDFLLAPETLSSMMGNVPNVAYKSGLFQVGQHLIENGILDETKAAALRSQYGQNKTVPSAVLELVGLFVNDIGGTAKLFRAFLETIRRDECEVRNLWETVGGKKVILEQARLFAVFGVQAKNTASGRIQMHSLASANRDPRIFDHPLSFNPRRQNLDKMLTFNGQEKEFEEFTDSTGYFDTKSGTTLKRGCPGRQFTLNFIQEMAPEFFPPETEERTCHGGMRARYGIKFESSLVTVRDNVKVEVLKADGKVRGKNLMIFLHGLPIDHPLGSSRIISKLKSQGRNALDFWSLVMPGFGSKSTPLKQCDWPRIGGYVADVVRHANESYDRVFLFGRGDGGYVAQYAAHEVGRDVLHGVITDALPPALYAASKMSHGFNKLDKIMLDPISSELLASDAFPLEDIVRNQTWFDNAWEWDFRSFLKKTGGRQWTCQIRSNWKEDDYGTPAFLNLDAAKEIDLDMHMLTISHELNLLKPESLMRYGLKRTSPRLGTVQRFEQVREKDLTAHFYDNKPAEELAQIVTSFVDQSIEIRYSLTSFITLPPDFHESAYKEDASHSVVTLYTYILTLVIMVTGIIMEVTIGPFLVGKFGFGIYLFAQVMATCINFGCFFAQDLITIPLYTLGLFKLGYPEVTSKVIAPLRHPELFHDNIYFRGISFLSGLAYVIHHTGGTLLYMVVSLHGMDALSIGFLAVSVGFQHLVVFVKYSYPNLHAVLLVALEVWFQLEAYYVLTFATMTAKVGVGMLLFSHYIWFIHGNFELVMKYLHLKEGEQEGRTTLILFRKSSSHFGHEQRHSVRSGRRESLLSQMDVQKLFGFDFDSSGHSLEETQLLATRSIEEKTSEMHEPVNTRKRVMFSDKDTNLNAATHGTGNVGDDLNNAEGETLSDNGFGTGDGTNEIIEEPASLFGGDRLTKHDVDA